MEGSSTWVNGVKVNGVSHEVLSTALLSTVSCTCFQHDLANHQGFCWNPTEISSAPGEPVDVAGAGRLYVSILSMIHCNLVLRGCRACCTCCLFRHAHSRSRGDTKGGTPPLDSLGRCLGVPGQACLLCLVISVLLVCVPQLHLPCIQ